MIGKGRWALVQGVDCDMDVRIEWLLGDDLKDVPFLTSYDKFVVVDEDKWPPEICALIAKRALVGE